MGKKGKNNVYLEDHGGSAAHLYNICRDVVWGIVQRTAADLEDYEQVEATEGQGLDDAAAVDAGLPMSFGASKKRKRKAPRKSDDASLPCPKHNGIVPEDNICMLKDSSGEWVLVKVLGVGPSSPRGQHAVVRRLCTDTSYEVQRQLLRPATRTTASELHDLWEKDFYLQMSAGRPQDVHEKYWDQRYRLFRRFDRGVRLDAESWYSVTYEVIAQYTASRCQEAARRLGLPLGIVVDAFCGCGGAALPFAASGQHQVMAVDMDAVKLGHLQANAALYHASAGINAVQDDVLRFLGSLADPQALSAHRQAISRHAGVITEAEAEALPAKRCYSADLVILSPPWGGPAYLQAEAYDLRSMLSSGDCYDLVALAVCVAPSVVLTIPRNSPDEQVRTLAALLRMPCRIENIFVSNKFKIKMVLFGPLALKL